MRPDARLLAAGAALLVGTGLAGCGSPSPHADLQAAVGSVVDAANSRNAVRLTTTVDDLLAEIARERDAHLLTPSQAARLAATAHRLRRDAALLEPAPAPAVTSAPAPVVTTEAPTPTPVVTPPPPKHKGKDKAPGGDQGGDTTSPGLVVATLFPSPSDAATATSTPAPAPSSS